MRKNQKGFTLVELLVVIAILAILATVAVVGYTSFIESANESNDKALVGQMNTALQGFDALQERPETIGDVVKAFSELDLSLNDYKTHKDGMRFYWVKSANRVIYVDGSNNVVYPEGYTYEPGQWYSLSGEIPFDDYTGEGGTYSVANGGQFAKLVNDYNNRTLTGEITINLTADIDLQGATCKIIGSGDKGAITDNFTINGNDHTIYGFRDDRQTFFGTGDYATRGYGYGLFANIGKDKTVTITNITFDGMMVEDTTSTNAGTIGLIAGYVHGDLVLNNVTIKNSDVVGRIKVGSIAGRILNGGKISMSNINLENITVGGQFETAALVGTIDQASSITGIDQVTKTNVTVYRPEIYVAELERHVAVVDYADGSYIVQDVNVWGPNWSDADKAAWENWMYPSLTQKNFWLTERSCDNSASEGYSHESYYYGSVAKDQK